MQKPVISEPFRALAAALKEGGFTTHGDRLEEIPDGTWTTSSELIAELGQAVLAIRKERRPLTRAQGSIVRECLRQVRRPWPGFDLFSWPPFVW